MTENRIEAREEVDQSTLEMIKNASISLVECKRVLDRVSATCCTPGRSPQMQEICTLLDRIIATVDGSNPPASFCLDDIAQCGSKIGYLYITCCIGKRAPRYERMLRILNENYIVLDTVINGGHH